ncbi:MAG: hypothetical protein WA989_14260 [Henriciella sp.]|uniref:hypothetical protein n=1 Tax=Henriciella sp. TaxID=1968823 RepID=UPI003C76A69E
MRLMSLIAAGGLIAACSSTPAPDDYDPAAVLPARDVVPKSGIGPQMLEADECALFLWSQTDASKFIFFEKAQSGTAKMQIGEMAVNVTQTGNRGEIFGQFLTEQTFVGPEREQIAVIVVPGDELQGGQRVESGRITITTAEGWKTVMPVLGVQACQS